MAKVTQVDFPPREIVSYTKETQTPVVTQEKEGESLFTFDRQSLKRMWSFSTVCFYTVTRWMRNIMMKGGNRKSVRKVHGVLWAYGLPMWLSLLWMWLACGSFPLPGQHADLHMWSMFHTACNFSPCAHCSCVLHWTLIAWLNFG